MLVAAHTAPLPTFPDAPATVLGRARAHPPQLQPPLVHSAQRVQQHLSDSASASPAPVASDNHSILASPVVPMREKLLAAQLAHLASQHHLSEHNRLKSGSKGPGIPYIPLSVQQPEHVRHLQVQQEVSCRERAWWLSDRKSRSMLKTHSSSSSSTGAPSASAQCTPTDAHNVSTSRTMSAVVSDPPMEIQQEISAAIAAPLNAIPFTISGHMTKTSETHPINISMVIPFEFLPVLTSQLHTAAPTSPFMFYIPPRYFLDSITSVPIPGAHTLNPHAYSGHRIQPNPAAFLPIVRPPPGQQHGFYPPSIVWNQHAGFDCLKSALNEGVGASPSENRTRSTSSGSPQHCSRRELGQEAPLPPPFYVPSQAAHLPPSPRRLMTDSPPVPVAGLLPSGHSGCQHLISAPLEGPSSFVPPPSPPTGLIRRPRHERASSAPPALAFPLQRSPYRKGFGFAEARGPGMGSANGLRKLGIPRNRSHPEVRGSEMTPSSLVPAFVLEEEGKPEQRTERATISDLPAGDAEAQERPSSFGTSLTQNPAFLKRSTERGQMLPPPLPTAPSWPYGLSVCCNPTDSRQRLGNLYLSSCPGKKVRLHGPVRGRGAICRDLRVDLSRVKQLGVGCIVCCLDDAELDFLGASWQEYSSVANELGLDVLRLPTPEGLAPLEPAVVDEHLTKLIQNYTLRGIPILAHCRGGVGRAGLIACCWLLKLGLCGWKDPNLCARKHAPVSATGFTTGAFSSLRDIPPAVLQQAAEHGATVCGATVQLVERVIAVVRRQRSLKAVETYEQVKFLVDFVEYLDSKSGPAADDVD